MRRLGISNRSGHIGLYWDGSYSRATLWESLWGSLYRRLCIVSVRSGSPGEIVFYVMVGIMVEIGLLLAGRDGRTGWDGSGMEGPTLAGAGLGAPLLSLEVRQAVGSGDYHQFHQCYRGRGVFVSVKQNNHNTLHTNPNFFYSTV